MDRETVSELLDRVRSAMLQKAMVRTSCCHVITLRGRLLRAAARQRLIVEVYRYGCSPRHRDRRERRAEFSRPFDKSGRRQLQRASRATAGSKGNRTLTRCRLRPRPVAGSGRLSMAKWLGLWTASSSSPRSRRTCPALARDDLEEAHTSKKNLEITSERSFPGL